jgi:hypothetical protein
LPGGMGRSPLLKELANSALLLSRSSVTDTGPPCGGAARAADPGAAFAGYLGSRAPGQPQVTTRP